MSALLSLKNIGKHFGGLSVLEDVSFEVPAGSIYGLIGPNGAGKTTVFNLITGLLAPSAGRMEILGLDLAANPVEVKRQIGVVPEGMALFGRLTGAEARMMVFSPGLVGQVSLSVMTPAVLVMTRFWGARLGNCGDTGGTSTGSWPSRPSLQLIRTNNCRPVSGPLCPSVGVDW